jgi:hypothetical protein
VQGDSIAQLASIVDHAVGVQDAVIADCGFWADPTSWVEMASLSHCAACLNNRKWVYLRAFSNSGRRVHHGLCADAAVISVHRNGVLFEALQGNDGVAKREVGVVTGQLMYAAGALNAWCREDSARLGGL